MPRSNADRVRTRARVRVRVYRCVLSRLLTVLGRDRSIGASSWAENIATLPMARMKFRLANFLGHSLRAYRLPSYTYARKRSASVGCCVTFPMCHVREQTGAVSVRALLRK